ncbi:MAG: prepilin-type N-terminal cleavage/methylation domain-containing protein [Candidatus Omnitrophica bacterium]|jgi:prepilin-type N-terminal cleavage/methylation domain-containing protein|nr:prepilin-type N-terminal cleavage/methylation domain-containing protein [Candidatus Omnitrophota bacterium]MDD5654887.1 prepilin-type N-terminal cleavage/methylation domain-containing protein [Candidatus Omnitrophota bacterium]
MRKAFTLIELLVVITIIAILAATIIPNFIGFDSEAKVTATKTNLDSIRTRITLFRAKEGKYPDSLGDFLTSYYYDAGIKKPYLAKIPAEMMSSKSGNTTYIDRTVDEGYTNEGGWVYFSDTAEVRVNMDDPLPAKWGEYADQKPSEW